MNVRKKCTLVVVVSHIYIRFTAARWQCYVILIPGFTTSSHLSWLQFVIKYNGNKYYLSAILDYNFIAIISIARFMNIVLAWSFSEQGRISIFIIISDTKVISNFNSYDPIIILHNANPIFNILKEFHRLETSAVIKLISNEEMCFPWIWSTLIPWNNTQCYLSAGVP